MGTAKRKQPKKKSQAAKKKLAMSTSDGNPNEKSTVATGGGATKTDEQKAEAKRLKNRKKKAKQKAKRASLKAEALGTAPITEAPAAPQTKKEEKTTAAATTTPTPIPTPKEKATDDEKKVTDVKKATDGEKKSTEPKKATDDEKKATDDKKKAPEAKKVAVTITPKDPTPCSTFTLDVNGEMGACTCGHTKTSHTKKEKNNAEKALSTLKQKNSSKDMSVNKTGDPCETYRIDASGDFGACICGHPKAAHEEQLQNNAEKALKKLKQKNSSKDMSVNKTGEPCNEYRIDASGEFGACICGHPKAAHLEQTQNNAAAALEKLNKTNAAKDKTVERRKSQGGAQCGNYRVDPAAKEFGACLCGHTKQAHDAIVQNAGEAALEALNAKGKPVDHAKHKRTASGGACGDFRLDTKTTGAFGSCLCGHPKQAHVTLGEDNAAKALRELKSKNKRKSVDAYNHDGSNGPCKNYVLDMGGVNFGDCKCSHSKNTHPDDCMPGSKAYKKRMKQEKEEEERRIAEAERVAAQKVKEEEEKKAAEIKAQLEAKAAEKKAKEQVQAKALAKTKADDAAVKAALAESESVKKSNSTSAASGTVQQAPVETAAGGCCVIS